jgi:hypothetical protein
MKSRIWFAISIAVFLGVLISILYLLSGTPVY